MRPEMIESWNMKKRSWFSDGSIEQSKQPGLLKREYGCSRGKFYGLSPKCYHISDGTSIKRSNKGTPKHINLSEKEFENALFGFDEVKKTFSQITTNKKLGTNCTKSVTKRALNSVYLKMRVADDLISVTPLMRNKNYI